MEQLPPAGTERIATTKCSDKAMNYPSAVDMDPVWERSSSSPRRPQRTLFAASIALLALVYHIILAVAANSIPNYAIAAAGTIYASIGAVSSIVGLFGALLKRRGLLCAFSSFLVVDAITAAACRLVLLRIFSDMLLLGENGACTEGAGFGLGDWAVAMERAPRHGVVTSARWQREHSDVRPAGCGWTVAALQVLAIGLVLGMATVQGALAMAVRKCANEVGKPQVDAGRGGCPSTSEKAVRSLPLPA